MWRCRGTSAQQPQQQGEQPCPPDHCHSAVAIAAPTREIAAGMEWKPSKLCVQSVFERFHRMRGPWWVRCGSDAVVGMHGLRWLEGPQSTTPSRPQPSASSVAAAAQRVPSNVKEPPPHTHTHTTPPQTPCRTCSKPIDVSKQVSGGWNTIPNARLVRHRRGRSPARPHRVWPRVAAPPTCTDVLGVPKDRV